MTGCCYETNDTGRSGAGDETTRRNVAGDGEADHLVSGGGLFDRRRGVPSPKRVPLATVEEVLRLSQEQYFDFNVRHFHES